MALGLSPCVRPLLRKREFACQRHCESGNGALLDGSDDSCEEYNVFIVLIFVAITHAGAAQYAPDVAVSTQHRTQDVWGNYNFGYDEKHATGGSWRKESSDASGNTVGSYGLYDA
ncbi:hypothetical protein MRX96_004977 [Rhipicephalus microplus]